MFMKYLLKIGVYNNKYQNTSMTIFKHMVLR